jgi:hypothetical protein
MFDACVLPRVERGDGKRFVMRADDCDLMFVLSYRCLPRVMRPMKL